jgi:hypothetical protein
MLFVPHEKRMNRGGTLREDFAEVRRKASPRPSEAGRGSSFAGSCNSSTPSIASVRILPVRQGSEPDPYPEIDRHGDGLVLAVVGQAQTDLLQFAVDRVRQARIAVRVEEP